MIYMDGDNNLENSSIEDFHELGEGLYQLWVKDYQIDQKFSIIVQYDDKSRKQQGRYEIQKVRHLDEQTVTLAGKIEGTDQEVDMGSGQTLKEFIRFCKAEYPSKHYALFLWNHGGGVRNSGDNSVERAICWDDSTEDGTPLYTGEISDILDEEDSVDLIAMDACLMGMAEIAYQYRPRENGFSAQVITFSPATEPSDGYEYNVLLSSIDDFSTLTPQTLSHHIVESYKERYQRTLGETQTAVDLTQMEEVVTKLNALSSLLVDKKADIEENVRGKGTSPIALHYFNDRSRYEWNNYAIFDLYDVANRIKGNNYSTAINGACSELLEAIDNAVISSYHGAPLENFEEGKNGLGFFFPDGDGYYEGSTYWEHQYFYTPLPHEEFLSWAELNLFSIDGYGALEMLEADEDGLVETWFELLQSWYNPGGSDQVHPGPMW